ATPYITPAVALTSPAGGEQWQAGTSHLISWSVTGCTVTAEVELLYSANGGTTWNSIGSVTNTGSYLWLVPNEPTTQALVRVQADGLSDDSEVFTIGAIPAPVALAATAGDAQ